jgi:hypothetical protein
LKPYKYLCKSKLNEGKKGTKKKRGRENPDKKPKCKGS